MKYTIKFESTEKEIELIGNFVFKFIDQLNKSAQDSFMRSIKTEPKLEPEQSKTAAQSPTIDQDLRESQPDENERLERMKHAAKEGEVIFAYFIGEWAMNFMAEGEQPDRGKLLNETMSLNSFEILSFIRLSGGLTNAIIKVSSPNDKLKDQREFIKKCRLIAENIAQVSSILYPPIAEHLEYPFKIQ
jgi:hypothetical protein